MSPHSGQPRPDMVVAVDGSASSAAALQWAAHHAGAREWRLRVVTAFTPPHLPAELTTDAVDHIRAAEDHARQRAREVIDAVLGVEAEVDHIVEAGPIEQMLRRAAEHAAMVVIGTRATTGWRAKLRGSLTNRITGSVACPVVSVTASGRTNSIAS